MEKEKKKVTMQLQMPFSMVFWFVIGFFFGEDSLGKSLINGFYFLKWYLWLTIFLSVLVAIILIAIKKMYTEDIESKEKIRVAFKMSMFWTGYYSICLYMTVKVINGVSPAISSWSDIPFSTQKEIYLLAFFVIMQNYIAESFRKTLKQD